MVSLSRVDLCSGDSGGVSRPRGNTLCYASPLLLPKEIGMLKKGILKDIKELFSVQKQSIVNACEAVNKLKTILLFTKRTSFRVFYLLCSATV